jgi:eukaryotic-like serine/threonine-protein kinase
VQSMKPVGCASRMRREDGTEVWRLAADDREAVRWLAWLGGHGIGGFTSSGQDAQGTWLVRGFTGQPLATWLRSLEAPVAWREAVELVRKLALSSALCEEHGIFVGPLNPHDILVDAATGGIELRAEPWVRSIVGAPMEGGGSQSLSSRWMAPEQAAGGPSCFASNRYVIGLVLYRLLANEHPFEGLGLRLAFEQAGRGAPPMREEVAATLPPGLQTLCLQMLDPDPAARPASARLIAQELERHLQQEQQANAGLRTMFMASSPAALTSAPAVGLAVASSPDRSRGSTRASDWIRRSATLAAIVIPLICGVALAIAVLQTVEPKAVARSGVAVPAVEPLDATRTTAKDCAYCHPRQTAEWHRSVMGHSAKSPLFQALEILIEEQVGRDDDCPHGAGILRTADPATACRAAGTGLPITGSGGALWCVNCHIPTENLAATLPAWDGRSTDGSSRLPLRDLVSDAKMEGIGCAFCHQVHGPVTPGNEREGVYEGNPSWTSFITGRRHFMRPEDLAGTPGIANSGYLLDPSELLIGAGDREDAEVVGVHRRPSSRARDYVRSSEFCGSCHDVRLFGTDGFGVKKGEHFKRLRNAYTEWVEWSEAERQQGREPASCVDCHMSLFPGICVPGEGESSTGDTAIERACPPGTRFEAKEPGTYPDAPVSAGASSRSGITTHYFTGVDVPLTPEFDDRFIDQPTIDGAGIPLGGEQRRDILLGRTFRFEIEDAGIVGRRLEIPIVIENIRAGHKVPAGFSQEREFWVHLRVTDAKGALVYEVGRVERGDEDLHDKIFARVNVSDRNRDDRGRPLGVFGADVVDGPDAPRWDPNPELGGTDFRGKGIVNLQNGFLRCVRCIGRIDAQGRCQPVGSQGRHRADRYDDGVFDLDTGECISNLSGHDAYFEVYYPVGALDSRRGAVSGPDAIIDTRSAIAAVPVRYTYDLPAGGFTPPFEIEARFMFRAFPPFLVRAFADYEVQQAEAGLRPSGPLVTHDMLERLEAVELHRRRAVVK